MFTEREWRLMRRLTEGLALLLVLSAGFCHVRQTYAQKFFDVTGEAQWIWATVPLNTDEPLAFFAAREFTLPEKRSFAHLKIGGDPQYELYVNGRLVSSARMPQPDRRLDLYDITPLVRTGRNRIVVGVRAPQGFGGLIASVDIAPEQAAWMVSDSDWKIYRRWSPAILDRDLPGQWQPPMILGEPPVGQWDFLRAERAVMRTAPSSVVEPAGTFEVVGRIPTIRTREGVAVAVTDRQRASVFDFGPVTGRVRLRLGRPALGDRMVMLRLINDARETTLADWNLRKVVFAPGEQAVTMPDVESFRYVMVFARNVEAEVVKSP